MDKINNAFRYLDDALAFINVTFKNLLRKFIIKNYLVNIHCQCIPYYLEKLIPNQDMQVSSVPVID